MNPRRLAGSRRNKHLRTVPSLESDWRSANRARKYRAAIRTAEIAPYAADTLLALAAQYRDPAQRSKPDHAARAVDIRTIWPPLTLDDSTAKRRKAAEAGARGKSAAPMSRGQRAAAYQKQTGRRGPTARQARQLDRMDLLRAS